MSVRRFVILTIVLVVIMIAVNITISGRLHASKSDLDERVTRAELAEIVSKLATKEDVKSEAEKTRKFIGELFTKHVELHH